MKQFKNTNRENKISDKIAIGIADSILKFQRYFSNKVQLRTARWKKIEQVAFLFLVCFVCGGTSIVVMVDCLKDSYSNHSIIPNQISSVKSIYKKGKPLPITDKEFRAIQHYKLSHPQLLLDRPGLYDSLQRIEQIYQSQKK